MEPLKKNITFDPPTTFCPLHNISFACKGEEKKKFYIRTHQSGEFWTKEYCFPRTLFNFGKVANAILIRAQEARMFKTDSCLGQRSLKQTLRLQKRRSWGEDEKWESFFFLERKSVSTKEKDNGPSTFLTTATNRSDCYLSLLSYLH